MASSDTFLNNLVDTLNKIQKQESRFYGWVLNRTESKSFQRLYSVASPDSVDLESVQERETEERTYSLRVYSRQGEPVKMGSVARTIDPFAPLESQIRETFESALLSENEPWKIAEPPATPFEKMETADPVILENPEKALQSMSDRMIAHRKSLQGVRINSAELYINLNAKYTLYSTGLELERIDSDAYIEAAMEKLPGPNTQEVHRYKKGVTVSEMEIESFLDEMAEETLALDETVLPETSDNATILVNAEVLASWLNALTDQLSADAEYNHSPHLLPGQQAVQTEESLPSDPLSVTVDPAIPLMIGSSPWTNEGIASKKTILIEENLVKNQIIGNRMGQYLKKEPNGAAGNFILPSGSHSKMELLEREEQCLEILAFSSLLINSRTLTWSSEIKLARLHKKGQSPIMIKGGVASGSIQKNFGSALYSSNQIHYNQVGDSWHPSIGYRGPGFALIRSGVKIAGSD